MRDRAKDKEIIAAATPGPWQARTEYMDEPGYEQFIKGQDVICKYKDGGEGTIARINWSNPVKENAEFIAAARTGWAEDLAELERLESENAELSKKIERLEAALKAWEAELITEWGG